MDKNVMVPEKFIAGIGRDFFIHPDQIDAKGGAEKFIPGLGSIFVFEDKHISEKGGYERYLHGLGRDFFIRPEHVKGYTDKRELTELMGKVSYVAVSTDGTNIEKTDQWATKAAKTALETAVAKAQLVIDNPEVEQQAVDTEVETLSKAIGVYTKAQKAGSKA